MTASQRAYLTSVYNLLQIQPKVLSVDVANDLDVSRPSVCKAMKVLCENGYIQPDYQHHIQLTASGEQNAKAIVKEENIVVSFFRRTLNLSQDQANEYANAIAHMLDPDILNRMQHSCDKFCEQINSIL